jgi:hypothetical protein
MATILRLEKYRCSDDCIQSGCPTHQAKLIYQSTTDYYEFDNGKGEIKYFERGELEVFIRLLKSINRVDCIQIK